MGIFIEKKCLNCGLDIKTYQKPTLNCRLKTDLSGINFNYLPPINICHSCNYIFYEDIKLNKKELNEYLQNKSYLSLFLMYKDIKPFFLVKYIYENQKESQKRINETLLYNYYYTENIDDLKYLVSNYKFLDVAWKEKMIIGEYFRQINEFQKANEIFNNLLECDNLKRDFIYLCEFQLELIELKNNNLMELPLNPIQRSSDIDYDIPSILRKNSKDNITNNKNKQNTYCLVRKFKFKFERECEIEDPFILRSKWDSYS